MPSPIEHLLIPQIQKKQAELQAALPPHASYLDGYDAAPANDLPGLNLNAPGVVVPETPSTDPYVWHDPTVAPPVAPPAPVGYLGAPQKHMWMDMPQTKEQLHSNAAADVAHRALMNDPKYAERGDVLAQMAQTDPTMAAYARAIGSLPNSPGYLQFKNGAVGGSLAAPPVAWMQQQERIAPPAGPDPNQWQQVGRTSDGKPVVKNPNGDLSTQYTVTFDDPRRPGNQVIIPSLYGGKFHSPQEAYALAEKHGFIDPDTGKTMPSVPAAQAEAFAVKQHLQQAQDPGFLKAMRHPETIIRLPAGQPVGYAENGQMVDKTGKPMGYLREDQGATKTLERGPKDVRAEDNDAFAEKTRDQLFGPYLKALDENDGRWPEGMFKGTSEAQRKAIHEGVIELRAHKLGSKT